MPSLAKAIALIGSGSPGGFGDDFASVSIIDDQYFRDGNEEKGVISVIGTTIDNVRIRRFRFRLNKSISYDLFGPFLNLVHA